jgi:hypothetical protein
MPRAHCAGGRFADAIVKYSDAMKRNPKDHVPYSNRAACYQKLMEWQLALKDAETCVTMEPTFVKGWSRKAGIHYFMKEYHKVRAPLCQLARPLARRLARRLVWPVMGGWRGAG